MTPPGGAPAGAGPRTDLRTAQDLTDGYASGALSPVTVAEQTLAAARLAGERYRAVSAVDPQVALAAAEASAARWAAGDPIGPLDGVPVSVKDSFPVVGLKRWHGSAIHDHLPPSTYDGAPVRRLREAGAVVFAKTTMPDFGLLAAGLSSQFGTITNPWDPAISPGGSSSGAGALLAAGVGPMAVGTDMGGSVRTPAAQCGVVALKTTQGRVAYDPPKLVGTAGPMGATVQDVARLLEVIGAPDPADHLSLPGRFVWDRTAVPDLAGLRVGVTLTSPERMLAVDPQVAAAVEESARLLERLGATLVPFEPVCTYDDYLRHGRWAYTKGMPELLAAPEAAWAAIPSALRAGIVACKDTTLLEWFALDKAMEQTRARWSAAFHTVDLVLSPVIPVESFPAHAPGPVADGTPLDHLMFTIPYNLTGLPAGTVPVALSTAGHPIGVQVGGHRFDDGLVLNVLRLLEENRSVELHHPVLRMTEESA